MALHVLEKQSLSQYTTLQLGGVADFVLEVQTVEELKEALLFAVDHTAVPPLILGGGSNVLCSDEGYRGVVIVNKIKGYEVVENNDSVTLSLGAGENLDGIIERTIADGYWGLENLSAIPGSIGATPIQNVGAYGVEISKVIESVEAIHIETGEIRIFSNSDCRFAYRDSFFKSPEGKGWCVSKVTYVLSRTPRPILTYKDLVPLQGVVDVSQQQIRDHVIAVRSKKFPDWKTVGTAGSFFKNPIISNELFEKIASEYPGVPGFSVTEDTTKIALGWILEKVCDLKGYRQGNVRLYEGQALVLVADGEATATEVEVFATTIAEKVKTATGIEIEREVLSV